MDSIHLKVNSFITTDSTKCHHLILVSSDDTRQEPSRRRASCITTIAYSSIRLWLFSAYTVFCITSFLSDNDTCIFTIANSVHVRLGLPTLLIFPQISTFMFLVVMLFSQRFMCPFLICLFVYLPSSSIFGFSLCLSIHESDMIAFCHQCYATFMQTRFSKQLHKVIRWA